MTISWLSAMSRYLRPSATGSSTDIPEDGGMKNASPTSSVNGPGDGMMLVENLPMTPSRRPPLPMSTKSTDEKPASVEACCPTIGFPPSWKSAKKSDEEP